MIMMMLIMSMMAMVMICQACPSSLLSKMALTPSPALAV
jgi:hypothetical protein